MASETLELSVATARAPRTIELPAPAALPIVLAFGFTLVFAGLVTSASVSMLGAGFTVAGCVGWFREVLPHQKHESVPGGDAGAAVASTRQHVTRADCMGEGLHAAGR